MKMYWLLPIVLLFVQTTVEAQKKTGDNWVFSFSSGFGLIAPTMSEHSTMESFNYTAIDNATGATSAQKFVSTMKRDFARPAKLIDLLDLEWTKKKNVIHFGGGLDEQALNRYGGYFRIGYSHIVPLRLSKLVLQAGLDVGYIENQDAKLGTISDSNRSVVLPGNVITHQQYSTLQDNGDGTEDYVTFNSDHVDVTYIRSALFAQPKLVLSVPLGRKMTIGLEAGWLLQIHQFTYLQYVENDQSGGVYSVIGHYYLPSNGSFNGPYVMLHVGICEGS